MLVVGSTDIAKFGLDCIGVVASCFGSDPVSSLGISLLGDPGVSIRAAGERVCFSFNIIRPRSFWSWIYW